MPVSQAEAVVASQAEVMLHNLANKQDIESFGSETTENFANTHKSIETLRAEIADCQRDIALTRKDVENLRSETRKDIGNIHKDIEALRADTKKDIHILRAELSRDLADGLHRQNRFMLTALMGFALLIIAFIEVRLLV